MFNKFRRRSRVEVITPGSHAQAAGVGADNPLVYDIVTGRYYYLLTKRKAADARR